MKKRINKKYHILLIFSTILFSTAIYFMSGSLILGASAGGAPSVSTAGGEVVSEVPVAPSVQQSEASNKEEATTESKKNEVPKEVYVVEDGQTLWEIAQNSGLSIQSLMNKNQLSSSVIVEGQELVFD